MHVLSLSQIMIPIFVAVPACCAEVVRGTPIPKAVPARANPESFTESRREIFDSLSR